MNSRYICFIFSLRGWRSCEKAENWISGGDGDEFNFWRYVQRVQKKRLGRGEKLKGRGRGEGEDSFPGKVSLLPSLFCWTRSTWRQELNSPPSPLEIKSSVFSQDRQLRRLLYSIKAVFYKVNERIIAGPGPNEVAVIEVSVLERSPYTGSLDCARFTILFVLISAMFSELSSGTLQMSYWTKRRSWPERKCRTFTSKGLFLSKTERLFSALYNSLCLSVRLSVCLSIFLSI